MKNTSLDPAIKRGRWHPGARASCVNRRCMGSRTVVLGQWAVSRQGLQSPVGDQDCKRPGRNSWGPVLCCLALQRNWPASGFPRRKFPTASREALPIPGLPVPWLAFFFRSLLSLGANLGDKPLVKSLWPGSGGMAGGKAGQAQDVNPEGSPC